MNRSAQLRTARIAGAALVLAAVVPAFSAGAALAAEAPAADVSATPTATSTESATAYADEVGIGTAVKIAGPGVQAPPNVQTTTTLEPLPDNTNMPPKENYTPPAEAADPDATPSDAEVIETDSIQNSTDEATEVAVLGTKLGADQLAETGPSDVGIQALVALALVALGLALFAGPQLWTVAASRRH